MNIRNFLETNESPEDKTNIESHELVDHSDAISEANILCLHCLRTKDNGIRCMGICVADSDY